MINCKQLRELVIKPSLEKLQLYSPNDIELMIFTCAVESNGGHYLKQIDGPALGIYQMEPKTYNDIWQHYILLKKDISLMMINNFGATRIPSEDRLIYDLEFATAMCRIHYMRNSEIIPDHKDPELVWSYYKRYYNTSLGSAVKERSLALYHAFISQT